MSFKKFIGFIVIVVVALFILSRIGSNLANRPTETNTPTQNGNNENPTTGGTSSEPIGGVTTGSGKTLVGFIPASPDSSITISLVTKGDPFKTARSLGAEVEYWYFGWNDIIKNGWGGPNAIMSKISNGTKSAVVISVINTATLSPYPNGYKSFADTGFADDYAKFVGEFAKKYKPDYLFIGNEVNTYLSKHSGEVGAFQTVLKKGSAAIKSASPNTRVGVSVAYRDGLDDNFELVKKLSADVDIIGYTVYAFTDPSFQFGEPKEGIDMLKKVGAAVSGKPYAVIETGWNSSPLLGSSEKEQAEFAKLLAEYIPTSDAEFVNWFILQDGNDCTNAAMGFLVPGQKPTGAQFETFKEFLCKFGMKHADGTPKEAETVWKATL